MSDAMISVPAAGLAIVYDEIKAAREEICTLRANRDEARRLAGEWRDAFEDLAALDFCRAWLDGGHVSVPGQLPWEGK